MNHSFYLLIIGLFTSFIFGCATQKPEPESPASHITLMTYNVENLFDTQKDPGKKDHTYLPVASKQTEAHRAYCNEIKVERWKEDCLKLDWSKEIVDTKLARLADVILNVNGGKGPDILILQEVENLRILKRLNREYLGKAGYTTEILLEGPDQRGIDVAFLSRLPLEGKTQLHPIRFKAKNESDHKKLSTTRGILQGNFRLPNGESLTVFGVHFPSPYNPGYMRKFAIETLNGLQKKLPQDRLMIAGGDFNITASEETKSAFYQKELGKSWRISHEMGCSDCLGTNYYHPKKEWSFLDALLFSGGFLQKSSTWEVVPSSIRIAKGSSYQVSQYMTPARYGQGEDSIGVSDHWPIVAEIRPR